MSVFTSRSTAAAESDDTVVLARRLKRLEHRPTALEVMIRRDGACEWSLICVDLD